MPIVSRVSRNLSPLEEEPQGKRGGDSDGGGENNDRRAFIDIATCILTSRPSEPGVGSRKTEHPRSTNRSSLQESEVFLPLTEQTLSAMEDQMEYLWRQGVPMCIEVKGQATPTEGKGNQEDELSSVLLEQWMIQILPRRSHSPYTSSQLLHQAVTSFLHFSQIRSWIVSCQGQLPFGLTYRVCAPGEENWEQFAQGEPVRHTFPGAALSQHSTLQVSVTLLPRLKHIPATLLGQVTEKPSPSRVCHFPEELMQKTSEMCITARRIRTHRESLPSSSAATRDGFPFSPLQPSPMSPKLLSGLADKSPYSSLTDTARLKSCRGCSGSHQEHDCLQHFCFDRTCVEQSHSHKHGQVSPEKRTSERVPVVYRQTGSSSTTTDNNSLGSSSVRPPAASSPVPFMLRKGERPSHNPRRRSAAINIKRAPPRPPLRSNSAPAAVPNLCLLGTFEESVLNGRLEPCGYVDGFTAELGASGSFCPRHVTLPVTAAFFSLSDDGGTSPYLGHINITGVGKRGYHVPKKGTVQLTLFNPNKTVVKIFVVTYDFSDMPANSQTFLRQKILSRPYHSSMAVPRSLPVLHYLIHLRFLCSKSGRVYLHTDIRLIFARRAPDTDPDLSKVALYTLMEGPSNPKYEPTQ